MILHIAPRGVACCRWGEAINLPALAISRASDVEPDALGRWYADLNPVGGPRLGPFERRNAALAAEADSLSARLQTRAGCDPIS